MDDDAYGDRERCGNRPSPPSGDDRICARSANQALIPLFRELSEADDGSRTRDLPLALLVLVGIGGAPSGGAAAPPGSADLSITKTDSPDPVAAGAALTYSLAVANAGPDTATNVVATDNLPKGVTFVSATSPQGSCSQSKGVVTCHLGTLAGPPYGEHANATIRVNAP